mmetsp:Transcript_15601/g.48505  ORF Transcript_15601/g.48505 Transcript_15601/m.48505 type:complete len:234 (+) Transcript_15601:718-1419(+)
MAALRGRVRLRSDARPGGGVRGDRGGAASAGLPNGSPGYGRRGFWQDRGGGARGLPGGALRRAGDDSLPNNGACQAALSCVEQAPGAVRSARGDAQPAGAPQEGPRRGGRLNSRGHRGRGGGHARAALQRRVVRAPEAARYRRGAALWCAPQGAHDADGDGGRRAHAHGDAHSAHGGAQRQRSARAEPHLHAAHGAAASVHQRRALRPQSGGRGHPRRGGARRADYLRGSSRE